MIDQLPGGSIAFPVSLIVCGLMIALGPRDRPDGARKTQARAIASSGGVGIAAGVLAEILVFRTFGPVGWMQAGFRFGQFESQYLIFQGATLAALLIGLTDDLRPLRAVAKMVLLASLSLITCAVGWQLLGFGHGGPPGPVLTVLLIAGGGLFVFVMMNTTNFMDGSNGLAMGCALIMLMALGEVHLPAGPIIPAIAGFLVWNLSGRLFAGDAGALYVGFFIAGLSLHGVSTGAFPVWIPPLIALPFLTDVFMTLIWRARRGENLMRAHTDHAYQLFRRAGWGHLQVAALWWAMTGICGALAICAARATPIGSPHRVFGIEFAVFAAALSLSIALWLWQRCVYGNRVSAPG